MTLGELWDKLEEVREAYALVDRYEVKVARRDSDYATQDLADARQALYDKRNEDIGEL